MKPSTVDIHVVQTSPITRDLEKNAAYAEEIIRTCGADIVLLPEMFLSGYQIDELYDLAIDTSHAIVRRLRVVCREVGVALVVGFIESGGQGDFYNSLLAVDQDGTVRDPIRKTHLFGKERLVFQQGAILEPVELCGRRWGVMNCFELEFPEVGRTLALRGAEGFLVVSANMRPYIEEHVLAARARSQENRLPVAYANRIGQELGYEFCGRSIVVDQDGRVVHAMDESSEGAVTVSMVVGQPAWDEVNLLDQLRPEIYYNY